MDERIVGDGTLIGRDLPAGRSAGKRAGWADHAFFCFFDARKP
jgi:hypothetical protein